MVLVLAKKKSQFANFIMKPTPYGLKSLAQILDASYSEGSNKTQSLTKETFSPSQLGYGSGACPRRWVMAFTGAEFEYNYSSTSVDNMENGTDRHERIQRNFHHSNLTLDVEYDLWSEDPPVHGYVDVIIRDLNGYDIVIEIKTTRHEAFVHRRAKNMGPDYQVLQLLLYLYLLEIDHGLLLYESKNTHEKLLIPIEMTPENREKVEVVVEWMRNVYRTFEEGKLPERPFTRRSKECKDCPLMRDCWDNRPDGDVKIEPMVFTMKDEDDSGT